MATEKEAKRVVTLDDIKFNEENKTMAALSCIPIVGLIMFFVEKDDLFVRYHAAQFTILGVSPLVLVLFMVVPILNIVIGCLSFIIWLGIGVAVVIGIVKTLQGERFDVPVVSGFALKLMNSIQ